VEPGRPCPAAWVRGVRRFSAEIVTSRTSAQRVHDGTARLVAGAAFARMVSAPDPRTPSRSLPVLATRSPLPEHALTDRHVSHIGAALYAMGATSRSPGTGDRIPQEIVDPDRRDRVIARSRTGIAHAAKGGGPSLAFAPHGGDLLVMGGDTARALEHRSQDRAIGAAAKCASSATISEAASASASGAKARRHHHSATRRRDWPTYRAPRFLERGERPARPRFPGAGPVRRR